MRIYVKVEDVRIQLDGAFFPSTVFVNMLIPQRRHERDLKCLIARMRHRWVAASKMPTFSNWALFANAVNKGAPIERKYLFKSREQSQKYWNKMVYRCSPTPCSPPPHFYTCARLNQTHSCWAESLQFQMCVCLIELLRAISVVTGTLLPLCSSHHVNKTIPACAKFTSKLGLFCHVLLRRPHK